MRGFGLLAGADNRNDLAEGVAAALETYGCWCGRLATGVSYGGEPVDDVDLTCRSWAQCRHCEEYAACEGEISDAYTPKVTFTLAGLEYSCDDLNECTTNRCMCDVAYSVQLANVLQELAANNAALDTAFQNLSEDQCVRASTGIGTNACCGSAPGWTLYNTEQKTCTGGELAAV